MDFKPFKIGKYLLLERLATGGMAEVYRAKASGAGGFEKQLAIKRILPTYSQNEEFRRMFEYEARLSSMLTHANIVQVYDFVKSGDTYLLAMEYVDGKNLRQFVNKARKMNVMLPLGFAAFVVNEVCKGLEYAHGKKDDLNGKPLNIIHRDMSPQNVMLSYDGAVKIVDFGIAKAKDRVDETRSGVIKGKFGYMSPEQANGLPIDHRSDIFSTGIILFELVTGRRLFSAENDMATLKLIQECVIPAPTRLNPKVPAEFEKIILKSLTKDLNLRYQNAGNFHRNIQSFLSKHFPNYTQKDAAETVSMVFRQEMEAEKKRLEQLHRQSIPFSQGAKEKVSEDWEGAVEPSATDGEVTKSDARDNTPVTFVDEAPSASESPVSQSEASSQQRAASPGDATRVDESVSNLDPQSIESLIVPDESVPTMAGGKTNPSVSERSSGGEKTELDTGSKVGSKDPSIVRSGGAPLKTSPSVTPRSATTNRGATKGKQSIVRKNTDPSGLILRNETTGNTSAGTRRQRDRSISALTEISGRSDNSISLDSLREPGAPAANRRESFYTSAPDEYRQPRKSRLGTIAFFSLIAIGTAFGYKLYLNGGLASLFSRRDVTLLPPPPRNPDNNTKDLPTRLAGDCMVEITTDPAGATVIANNKEVGVSATTISGNCNTSLNLTLKLEGFEPVSENVYLKEPVKKFYKTLKRTPSGQLEIVLNQNAKVYVEGRLIGEAAANQVFLITLRAGRLHKVRFVNEIFGIDAVREFSVEVDSVSRQSIRLDSK